MATKSRVAWTRLQVLGFWAFQFVYGVLFSIVFLIIVPQAVDGWLLRGLSIALGGFGAVSLMLLLVAVIMDLRTMKPNSSDTPDMSVDGPRCPHCGQRIGLARDDPCAT